MNNGLTRLSLRMIWAKKKRLLLSSLGATFGIALLVSLIALYGNLTYTLEMQKYEKFGPTDLMVGYRGYKSDKVMTDEQIVKLNNITGIEKTGQALINFPLDFPDNRIELKKMMLSAIDDSKLTLEHFRLNRRLAKDEVALSSALASRFKVQVNDVITLPMPQRGEVELRVSNIIDFSVGESGAPEFAYISADKFSELYGMKFTPNLILVDIKQDSDKNNVISAIKNLVDSDLEIDKVEPLGEEKKNVESLKVLSYAIGMMAILAGAMFVLSNFLLSIRERYQELATLRAVGASKLQIYGIVLREASIIACSATIFGYLVGTVAASVLSSGVNKWMGIDSRGFFVPWFECALAALAGCLFIFLIALFPARQAAKVHPIALVRDSKKQQTEISKRMKAVILLCICLGIVLLIVGFTFTSPDSDGVNILCKFAGGLLVTTSIFLSISFWVKVVLNTVSRLVQRAGGSVSILAIKNLIAERKQSGLTIFVLALAPTLFLSISGFMNSYQVNLEAQLKEQFLTEFRIKNILETSSDLHYNFTHEIEKIPGVSFAIPVSYVERAKIKDFDYSRTNQKWLQSKQQSTESELRIEYKLVDLKKMMNQGWLPKVSGDLTNQIFVTKEYANNLGIKSGDTLTVEREGRNAQLMVAGIVDRLPMIPAEFSDVILADWGQNVVNKPYSSQGALVVESVLIQPEVGRKEAVAEHMKQLLSQNQDLRFVHFDEAVEEIRKQVRQRMAILTVATGIIWLVGLLGGMTTLSANFLAKRREYAILRAIAITPRQLTKIVLIQGSTLGMTSFMLGSFLGYFLGFIFAKSFQLDFIMSWDVMTGLLFGSFVLFLLALIQPWRYSVKLGKEKITEALFHE